MKGSCLLLKTVNNYHLCRAPVSDLPRLTINADHFEADTMYSYSFGLNLPDISILGISLGQYDGTLVDLDGNFTLYAATSWKQDGVEFFVIVRCGTLILMKWHSDKCYRSRLMS
jgi:hypothetical protein